MPPAETTGLTKLYVTDLPPGVESEALRECFSKFGELGEVRRCGSDAAFLGAVRIRAPLTFRSCGARRWW